MISDDCPNDQLDFLGAGDSSDELSILIEILGLPRNFLVKSDEKQAAKNKNVHSCLASQRISSSFLRALNPSVEFRCLTNGYDPLHSRGETGSLVPYFTHKFR
jgi:hypothetical protein